MAITKIKVSNFKSFEELEIELRALNIVVGGNASGKSNLVEIFRFVRDVVAHGLENAVSIQGGMEYLTNLQLGARRPLILELTFTEDRFPAFPLTYRLELVATGSGRGFDVVEESVKTGLEDGDLTRFKEARFPDLPFGLEVFDLEPKLSKRANPIGGKADLEPDGSNLAIVLRNVLQDEAKRNDFLRLLRDLLPFVEDLRIERFSDKSMLFALEERYSKGNFVPAVFLSDGTIHLTALILVLYFDRASVAVIEEPERNIHPRLISRLVALLVDGSRRKQIVVTTHNPELVKHADLKDLLLVQRDPRGFSRISRPAESEELKVFLENDLGVDDLFVQDLLGLSYGI